MRFWAIEYNSDRARAASFYLADESTIETILALERHADSDATCRSAVPEDFGGRLPESSELRGVYAPGCTDWVLSSSFAFADHRSTRLYRNTTLDQIAMYARNMVERDPSRGLYVHFYPARPDQIAVDDAEKQKMWEAALATERRATAINLWWRLLAILVLAYAGGALYGLWSALALAAAGLMAFNLARFVWRTRKS